MTSPATKALVPPDAPEMVTITETISPDIAAKYLLKNSVNRNLTKSTILALIRDMQSGKWELTEQGIAFDEGGSLVDGQHRLTAIVESRVSVRVRVTRNAPTIWAVRDRNRTRTIDQFLVDQNGSLLTSGRRITSLAAAYELLTARTSTKNTIDKTREFLELNSRAVTWALDTFPVKTSAPLSASFVFAYPTAPKQVAAFATAYISLEDQPPGSPAILLYQTVAAVRRFGSAERVDIMLKTLYAIRASMRGKETKQLRREDTSYEWFLEKRNGLGLK